MVAAWRERLLQLTVVLIDQLWAAPDGVEVTLPSAWKPTDPRRKDKVPKETWWQTVKWTPESAYAAWSRMFNLLGDVNRFSVPDIHELAMSTLRDVFMMIQEANELLPSAVTKPISLHDVMLPGLIGTLLLESKFLRGKLHALWMVHALVCQRETPLGLETLSHVYSRLRALVSSDSKEEVLAVTTDRF